MPPRVQAVVDTVIVINGVEVETPGVQAVVDTVVEEISTTVLVINGVEVETGGGDGGARVTAATISPITLLGAVPHSLRDGGRPQAIPHSTVAKLAARKYQPKRLCLAQTRLPQRRCRCRRRRRCHR